VRPLSPPSATSAVDFGVEISNVDSESPTDSDFDAIRTAPYNSHAVVLKNQKPLSPKAQYELTKRFDPASNEYDYGRTLDSERSILYSDLKTIPYQPQVQALAVDPYEEYEGLKNIIPVHPHHKKFHKSFQRRIIWRLLDSSVGTLILRCMRQKLSPSLLLRYLLEDAKQFIITMALGRRWMCL
jgi:hypothetical protein